MADLALAPREPSIASSKLEISDGDLLDATVANTAIASESTIANFGSEVRDESSPNENTTDSSLVPRELTIASLDLGEDDEDFADGIACVQAYWAQASQMDSNTQEQMRQLIITKQFALTSSSRQSISKHRLYRGIVGKDEVSTWPIFLILKAIYKDLPQSYVCKVRSKELVVDTSDYTSDYLAAYPNTIWPRIFDTNTIKGMEYREMWPRLKNTPSTYRKSKVKNGKQPPITSAQATMEQSATVPQPVVSSGTTSDSLEPLTSVGVESACSSAQQSQRRGKKRPASGPTPEPPKKRLPEKEDDFEFDQILIQMTLPGVPSSEPTKVDLEKEVTDLKENIAQMRQQMHTFMKVTADVVTSMKTEIENLKEENKSLRK